MTDNTKSLFLFVMFMAALGWAGAGDYEYRCEQAKKMNKHETCK